MKPRYHMLSPLVGELRWDSAPSDALLAVQLAWMELLTRKYGGQTAEIRQGFTTLSIAWKSTEYQIVFLKNFSHLEASQLELSSRVWELPVCYDEHFGKDLRELATSLQMSLDRLIELHSSTTYRLHFFGFLPGFMYLNGLPEQLHFPRKAVPDRKVEAGSVGIGGSQTGIYPSQSPGGWYVIGRCPLLLFDIKKSPPVFAHPGDLIRFRPIDPSEMEELLSNPLFPQLQ